MSWSTQEKTFCVEVYFANKSYTVVQEKFRRHFRCRHAPSKSRIFDWTKKFRKHGTVHNFNSKCLKDTYSGRSVNARTERNIDVVRDSVGRSPKKSIRRHSQELGIPRESTRRVLKLDINLYPYRIQINQKLTQADIDKRVTMCEWFCDTIEDNTDFLDHVWFSDEAHFLRQDMSTARIMCIAYSSTAGCLTEAVTFKKVHSMDSHFQTWHHRPILVWGWKWTTSNDEHGALCGSTEEVLGIIVTTQRNG